eukprot:scaffold34361_cov94-Cyclotella_meneghiniana.AAC.2
MTCSSSLMTIKVHRVKIQHDSTDTNVLTIEATGPEKEKSISMEMLEEKCGDETYAFNECYERNEAAEACVHCALEELFASGVGCGDDLRSEVDKDASTCTECLEECGTQFEALAECSIEEFCGKEARSAALSLETDDGDSIASWTSDKDTRKSAEFRYLPSGSTEDSFAASNLRYSGEKSNLQRWEFNQDTGSISNIACPNLAISSSKQKDKVVRME